jgi:hypothetical protein
MCTPSKRGHLSQQTKCPITLKHKMNISCGREHRFLNVCFDVAKAPFWSFPDRQKPQEVAEAFGQNVRFAETQQAC